MADFDLSKFVTMIFAVIVAVIMTVVVLIPIIADNQVATGTPNADAINSIINIIPILVICGILLAIVGGFLYKKYKN